VADGDYERGRDREIASLRARLAALAKARAAKPVFVLNGWAAAPAAWDLCRFARTRIFSYVEQLDGAAEAAMAAAPAPVTLVGWSLGASVALGLACRFPARVAGLVLLAATPRMMEARDAGWRGMSPRRLEALRKGAELTHGAGFFGLPPGVPNPYLVDAPENLDRGIRYLLETDRRAELAATSFPSFPVFIFQSERDGIVRPENAAYLKTVFPQAQVRMVPGAEHALPIRVPGEIDAAVAACVRSS